MFLNENYGGGSNVDINSIVAQYKGYNHPIGIAGAAEMNLRLSEGYHELVESMLVAEHTAIVNEDANLLLEAENKFFEKIKELWSRLKKWVVGMWNKICDFFRKLCSSNKSLAKKVRDKKSELKDVTYNGYNYGDIRVNIIAITGQAISRGAEQLSAISEVRVGTNLTQDMINNKKFGAQNRKDMYNEITRVFKIANNKKLSDITSDDVYKDLLSSSPVASKKDIDSDVILKVVLGAEEPADYTYKPAQILGMADFIEKEKIILKDLEKQFKSLIKAYNECEKYFDKLSKDKSLGENATKIYSSAASICRKYSSCLNTILGVAQTSMKKAYSIARAVCLKAVGSKTKDDDKKKSESVLDLFRV